jgi:hypothetical protein
MEYFVRKIIILGCFILGVSAVYAADVEGASELDALRELARAEVGDGSDASANAGSAPATSGALALQALNPEISIVGDMLWRNSDALDSDFIFRTLGIHAQAYLDPYTMFKAALEFSEEGSELGEAYMTRFGLIPHVNLTLGKFRQQFGVVNRWHKHGLDQVDFPLALQGIFGEEGLNQVGVSFEWSMPTLLGLSQSLIVQVTDGQNDRLFGENSDNKPAELIHYKLFRDLTDSTYAECGLSALYGQNSEWSVGESVVEDSLDTFVFGVDFTVLWEPTDNMRYRNLTWRSEAFVLNKDLLAPDASGKDTIDAWGAYSYVESKLSRTVILGVRLDYFAPDSKAYAGEIGGDMAPLVVGGDGGESWQACPYITWNQSPFVHFRAEYDYQDGDGPDENTIWLQCIFAAGPHKHERY